MHLDTDIKVILDNTSSEEFKLFVPLSIVILANYSNACDKNKATLPELMNYIRKISPNWDKVALKLGIPKYEVEIFDCQYNHPNNVVWTQTIMPASWCCLVQTLAICCWNV